MLEQTKLSKALVDKRGDRALQACADESGIKMTTLYHLEQGRPPDRENFMRAMNWLEVPKKDWWRYMEQVTA